MKLRLIRKYKKETYCIGNLYVDGVWFCNTCEDKDRGLKQTDSLYRISAVKVPAETAIPTGIYKVRIDIVSPKYSSVDWYKQLCDGKMPRIMNVPGFEWILIHPGNSALDSSGCVLCGKNTVKGGLTQSKETFKALYQKMKKAADNGEQITLEIV